MDNVFEMPPLHQQEKQEEIKQKFYFEFEDEKIRANAMEVVNEIRAEHPDIFEGLESVKIDSFRPKQGLEFAFSSNVEGRDQKILNLLHQKGVRLNTINGNEEMPHMGIAA